MVLGLRALVVNATQQKTGRVEPHRIRSVVRRRRSTLVGLCALLVAFGIWDLIAAESLVRAQFLPGPGATWHALVTYLQSANAAHDVLVSSKEYGIGIGLAAAVGITIGLLMGWYRIVHEVLNPFVSALYSAPLVALAPLVIVWFGIGQESKVVIVFIICAIPILISTAAGVRTVDPTYVRLAHSYGASQIQVFRTVILPGSVSNIMTGIRMAVSLGLVGVVVGELFAAQAGLGFALVQAEDNFDTPLMFALLGIFLMAGIVLTAVVHAAERRLENWRGTIQR